MKAFVLRVEVDETGAVAGVVERVRTGEKERFTGFPMLVEILGHMVTADPPALETLDVRRRPGAPRPAIPGKDPL